MTLHAMAAAILEHRRALRMLSKAVGWADVGAPFGLIPPGPHSLAAGGVGCGHGNEVE